MQLNGRAACLVEGLLRRAEECRVASSTSETGCRLIDCGVSVPGGLQAGVELARICLSGLAEVSILPGEIEGLPCPMVQVVTDHPVSACLASQYAGWQLNEGKFFAMGSGPMRAAAGREDLFAKIGRTEKAEAVVGVLETRKPPPPEVVNRIADACGVATDAVALLYAPTASLAGGVQIVARSVETALHKLLELDFDLERIVSAQGTAPLPPVARDDLAAIGRTNDAILYGARVVLYVTGPDDTLLQIGHEVPSSSSRDHGAPFAEVFARYNHDFYAVDPLLFSPAEVVFQNLESGLVHKFGQTLPQVLARSFFPT
jgi:methenyltetrahydromethanopterin cyclohydrolase